MTSTQIYQLYIRAEVEEVFQALLDPDFTRRYFHGTAFTDPPRAGQPYALSTPDGTPAVDGSIEVLDPPHRLVQTWHVRYDPAMEAEPPSRVEWTLTRAGEGLTLLRVVHGDLARSPLTAASVSRGWDWVLGGLKTVLETGMPLPPVASDPTDSGVEAATSAQDITGDWHRAQAIEINNAVWDQLAGVAAGTATAVGLVRGAYAAAYHWERATGAGQGSDAGERGTRSLPHRQGLAGVRATRSGARLWRPDAGPMRSPRVGRLRPGLCPRVARPVAGRAGPGR